MGVVGMSPGQRRRVSVKVDLSENTPSETPDGSTEYHAGALVGGLRSSSARVDPPSQQHTAAYVAQMCTDLATMAKGANLPFLAHLLAMAHAEAERAADATT